MSNLQRVRQFLRALRAEASGFNREAAAYAAANLSPAEFALWREQSAADRDHSYRVARTAERLLIGAAAPERAQIDFIAAPDGLSPASPLPRLLCRAALLHDCGRGQFGTSLAKTAAVLLNAICPQKSRCLADEAAKQRQTGQAIDYIADLMYHHYNHAAIGAAKLERIFAAAKSDAAESAAQSRIVYLIRHHHDGAAAEADLKILIAADKAN